MIYLLLRPEWWWALLSDTAWAVAAKGTCLGFRTVLKTAEFCRAEGQVDI
jgi:hypothetical protein